MQHVGLSERVGFFCHFLNILFEVYYSRIYKGIIQNVESTRKRQKTS